jgi:hypothetical protein
MYTGRTETPCCLCGSPETAHRIEIPPRAIQLLRHSDPIAWQDIEGEISLYFCRSDWGVVRDLVLETGMNPLSRCNAGRASFVLREDFEALLNDTRPEPDQRPLERECLAEAERVRSEHANGNELIEERDLVEARIVEWSLEELETSKPAGD